MKKSFLILDCFVDEPACLGVPPFIASYPRYIYGGLITAGADPEDINYQTIDEIRDADYYITGKYSMVFVIGGAVVPGRYLGARIGTLAEINRIIEINNGTEFAVGGLIGPLVSRSENLVFVSKNLDSFAASVCRETGVFYGTSSSAGAEAGAELVKLHPWYPDLIAEIETYSGCPREKHCSFCTEGLSGPPVFRDPEDILKEIEALISAGIHRFRLGQQADILQYGSSLSGFKKGFPAPCRGGFEFLFNALKDLVKGGKISVLNIDNANPGTIANFPEESAVLLEIIAESVTPGDTMALGVESFDQRVVEMNSLKAGPDEVFDVVKLINRIGGYRKDGLPVILPGINLLHGLKGENSDTFKKNYVELKRILDAGLLIKRINIRQVQPYPGTPLYEDPPAGSTALRNRFLYYRDRIRSEIDRPMLQKIYPPGTVLKNSMVLDKREGFSYLKQIASYAITLITAEDLPNKSFADMMVVAHRERSLVAVPIGENLNSLSKKSIESVYGIGRRQASEIVLKRPFKNRRDAEIMLGAVGSEVKERLLEGI